MKLTKRRILRFLDNHAGKIVGVGDIFDHSRSSVVGESIPQYLERTRQYWQSFDSFVIGNHDAFLLRKYGPKYRLCQTDIYRNGPVLALHGHQLKFSFQQAKVIKYEREWYKEKSQGSMFWDIEEFFCRTFHKYFRLRGKRAYSQALLALQEIDKAGLLDDEVTTVIMGHTHLSYKQKVEYKGKKYKVINCGSSLHGKKFNPYYCEEIDRWFVSDFHLGTAKSVLN